MLSAATRWPPAEKPQDSDALRRPASIRRRDGAPCRPARCASCKGGPCLGRPARTGTRYFTRRAIHSQRIEPLADFGAFQIEGQDVVASAGKNDTAAPVFARRGRAVKRQALGCSPSPAELPAFPRPGHRWVWWCLFPARVLPYRPAAFRARAGWHWSRRRQGPPRSRREGRRVCT